jgi:hypothetical protein
MQDLDFAFVLFHTVWYMQTVIEAKVCSSTRIISQLKEDYVIALCLQGHSSDLFVADEASASLEAKEAGVPRKKVHSSSF